MSLKEMIWSRNDMARALGNENSVATHVLDDDDDQVYNEII